MSARIQQGAGAQAPAFPDPGRAALLAALDVAHRALRTVDASNQTEPQTEDAVEAVSEAVALIEKAARDAGHVLPEFRRPAMPAAWRLNNAR